MSTTNAVDRLKAIADKLGPLDAWPAIHAAYGTPASGDLGEVDIALASDLREVLSDNERMREALEAVENSSTTRLLSSVRKQVRQALQGDAP